PPPRGRLRLGTMESTAASRLPTVLARYHHAWPDVSLELLTGTTGWLIDRVRDFEIDAALFARPPAPNMLPDTFETVPVFRENLVLLTPRGHPPVRTPRDVILPTLIAFERGCSYRKYVEQWYAAHGVKPARVLELGSYHAIVACVAAGAGVAVAPRSVLDLQPETGNIAAHAIPELEGIDTLLAWRQGYASAALAALREALTEAARQPDGAAKPPVTVPA
uniref:LysR substrate-binding domain-containing protein n=1 Tax=Burkholderia sp. LMG 13014 TaxID=2709306 RepID=UPI001965653D